ncbi:MAG: glycosyltransferase family 2 protein [Terriglobales bacterium]
MPLVSVLMTAYNREDFIADAIESVLAQTFTDWELIIVDDCSRDRTVEIARRYAAQDGRIRVHVNERNLGDYPNRNHAATLATGEFMKYHDSDDLMYPHCLAVMVPLLTAYPQAGFALTAGGREWSGGPCPMLLTPLLSYQREFFGLGMFQLGPACALFRTEVFRRLGGFPLHGAASDNVFWLNACKSENVLLVPGSLFWYRRHPGQELVSPQAERSYALANRYVWEVLDAEDCPLQPIEREQAKRNWIWVLGKRILLDFRRGDFKRGWKFLSNAGPGFADWLRYFRRQRRDIFAGTPRNAAGDFIVPDWSVFEQTEPRAKSR